MVFQGFPELPGESDSDNLRSDNIQITNYGQNTSDESDMEEGNPYEGYQPLPLGEHGEEMDEANVIPSDAPNMDSNIPNIISSDVEIQRDIWNEPRPEELSIELDNTRTQQIMNAMASITLPNSAIPDWAQGVPEERWKQDLLERIRQRKDAAVRDDQTDITKD